MEISNVEYDRNWSVVPIEHEDKEQRNMFWLAAVE